MEITKVVVGRSRKVNMGNYETQDVHVSLEAQLVSGDDPDEVFVTLVNKCDEYVDAEAANLLKEKLKKL